ncbi:hypothetical protein Tco_1108340 [Tanacetum coccineum]
MQTTIPTPNRYPRTYFSSDKTISKELTAIVSPTTTTTSTDSSIPKRKKRSIPYKTKILPGSIAGMCRRHEMPHLVNLAVNKDHEVDPINVPELISNEFAIHGPKMIEELFPWDKFLEIKHACKEKQHQSEEVQELLNKLLQDLQSINEELAEFINTPSWNLPTSSYDDDDDEYSFATQEYLMTCSTAITPDSPKTDSLIMEDEHLDTIPETESDEFIKSSVEGLVQNPSESEDERSLIRFIMRPRFYPKDVSFLDAESYLLESLVNRDTLMASPPKIDFLLDEFADELTRLQSIPPGIDNINLDPEGDILFLESLLYDNSSPPGDLHANSK